MGKPAICLVIYASPEGYPPVHSLLRVLEKDFQVVLVCRNIEEKLIDCGEAKVYRVGVPQRLEAKFRRRYLRKALEYFRFVAEAIRQTRRHRCCAVYGFDPHGFFAAFLASRLGGRRLPLVYHNFDINLLYEFSFFTRYLKYFELGFARRADKVVFSSRRRAEVFEDSSPLKERPLVVMNAPLTVDEVPVPRLREQLRAEHIPEDARFVIYQGVIDDLHSIDTILISMEWWPRNVCLLLFGSVYGPFRERMEDLIRRKQLVGRVFVMPFIPFDQFFPFAIAGADLGMGLFKPIDPNLATMAGASNKVLQYLALGIPPVVNDSEDFRSLFSEEEVYFAQPYSPYDIARAVNEGLGREPQRAEKARRCRQDHLERMNFETQFAPVLAYLRGVSTALAGHKEA